MFAALGRLVYRFRFAVLGVVTGLMLVLGALGTGVAAHLTQGGWDDPSSDSTVGAAISEEAFGRDGRGDVVVMYTVPEGQRADAEPWASEISSHLDGLLERHKDTHITAIESLWSTKQTSLATADGRTGVASISVVGTGDEIMRNYGEFMAEIPLANPQVTTEIAGQQPISKELTDGMDKDVKRAELVAIPLVAVLLFFVFGSLVAMSMPLIVGGLSILGASGLLFILANATSVNAFAQSVVTLIGLGLAIDYALIVVSRFREELGGGEDVRTAVVKTVTTAGRTVTFSAIIIAAALAGLLLFPQGFLKSVAYGAMSAVGLAALLSITVLPALLGIVGRRIDSLGIKAFKKTKTPEEIDRSFWSRIATWSMRRPVILTIIIVAILLALIAPFANIKLGGLSERLLPTNNEVRIAQDTFDERFPQMRTNPVNLVIEGANSSQVREIRTQANAVEGLTGDFAQPRASGDTLRSYSTGILDADDNTKVIEALKAIPEPDGVNIYVTGNAAMEYESIRALLDKLPLVALFVVLVVTLLMFLAFGSLVLPLKAALMSILTMGSTMGVLTLIFVDGLGSELLNFTPGPLASPVLVLIMAIIFGLSTDYEVLLVSRMVEARANGASTKEAIRIGTAHTGGIITAAALILAVVVGAFAFSDIVMTKYIAFGMMAALILDATVIRLVLVPTTMTLLGDDCWWAPRWLKRLQQRIGLHEFEASSLSSQPRSAVAVAGAAGATGAAAAGLAADGAAVWSQPTPVGAGEDRAEAQATAPGSAFTTPSDLPTTAFGLPGSTPAVPGAPYGRPADPTHPRPAERHEQEDTAAAWPAEGQTSWPAATSKHPVPVPVPTTPASASTPSSADAPSSAPTSELGSAPTATNTDAGTQVAPELPLPAQSDAYQSDIPQWDDPTWDPPAREPESLIAAAAAEPATSPAPADGPEQADTEQAQTDVPLSYPSRHARAASEPPAADTTAEQPLNVGDLIARLQAERERDSK